MIQRKRQSRTQRMIIVNGLLAFAIVVVVLQLWLLTATMNGFLGGDSTIGVPAALASLACLGVNLWVLRAVYRLD